MAANVRTMLHQALDAFARLDPIQAAAVVRSDKEVDKEWKGALRHLITYMIEDPRTISRSIDMIFIARALERIGDHAKNMSERVIYMVKGADVRHTGVKNTERLARGEEDERDEAEGARRPASALIPDRPASRKPWSPRPGFFISGSAHVAAGGRDVGARTTGACLFIETS